MFLPVLMAAASVFVEAESFSDLGGWSLDAQHVETMGSPYLLAHGLGSPVADAKTEVFAKEAGSYVLWVRTRNWTAPWSESAAGRFQVSVNGRTVEVEFGVGSGEWRWVKAEERVSLKAGANEVVLHDLTGFDGRVDAICFADGQDVPRRPDAAVAGELEFDLVVCGGGVAGTCAAVAAARNGLRVALLQDRPVLGGNNSSEVRVWLGGHIHVGKYPRLGDVVAEIAPAGGGNARSGVFFEDDRKLSVVRREKNIALFLGTKAVEVEKSGDRISAVIGQDVRTGERRRFVAPLFVDATGDGTIGFLAGAEFRVGRESRAETGERLAPEKGDRMTMGASCQWRAIETGRRCAFAAEPWMLSFDDNTATMTMRGDWDWEAGLDRDQISEAEYIRDYGLLVAYSNWSFVKNRSRSKEDFATKRLEWVAYVAGKRESRRLMGDLLLSSEDILEGRVHPDGTCLTSWSIDLHYPKTREDTGFAGESFRSRCEQEKIVMYPVPYRCLYSRNVRNLFMAGRNVSVTHAALGTVRVMRTTGMMGEVVGMAAAVCRTHSCEPRDVYGRYFKELEEKMAAGAGRGLPQARQTYNLHPTLGTDYANDDLKELHGLLTWGLTKLYWHRREFGKDDAPTWDFTPGVESGVFSAGELTEGTLHCLSRDEPRLFVGKSLDELRQNRLAGKSVEVVRGALADEWKSEAELTFHYFYFEGNILDTWYRAR